jgi:hypothetical protein
VLGGPLLACSFDPLTGFFRDGCCHTGPDDLGSHTVCARVTEPFLAFSRKAGNDLSTPRPEFRFKGLQPGDRFVVPNVTFWLLGGISVHGVHDAVIQIDGTLAFSNTRATWPTDAKGHVLECLTLDSFRNVTFTSGGHGTIDGNGTAWWGAINFAIYGENRPRLLALPNSQDVLVEHILFKNSPYWTFYAENANNLIIRYSEVDARITNQSIHTLEDLTAFNTDGFDGMNA